MRRGHFRTLPLTKFYDTPDPLPQGTPGALIRAVQFDDYDLPMDVSAVRILYHSRGANGQDVAASGVVLFPDKKPPAAGWPIIAWAHDLSGVARSCAPSLARNLRHGSFLSMYVQLGYAIVATDYSGLGTSSRSAFADMTSNANDVIDSIPAARKAVPQLGKRWVAMGTVEGGMAVLAVAESEYEIRDPNYLGAIAIARIADLRDLFRSSANLSGRAPLFLAYGVQTLYPQFSPSQILTDKATVAYKRIAEGCGDNNSELAANEELKPKWEENPFVQKYFERNRAASRPAEGPLLLLASDADISINETENAFSQLCKQGDRIQFERYPGEDSGRLIGDSVRDQIAWIESVFAGRTVRNDCKTIQ